MDFVQCYYVFSGLFLLLVHSHFVCPRPVQFLCLADGVLSVMQLVPLSADSCQGCCSTTGTGQSLLTDAPASYWITNTLYHKWG